MRILVPTCNDSPNDYDCLFDLTSQVLRCRSNVVFDFSNCQFLRHNAVALLGGMTRLAQARNVAVSFDWQTLIPKIYRSLQQTHFVAKVCGGHYARPGTAIPYREDSFMNKGPLSTYLTSEWLGWSKVNLSQGLRNAIAGKVIEIYDNAFAHSISSIGVMSCGRHYPNLRQLCLTVVDFGVGIPFNVRSFLRRSGITDADALQWAFEVGTTTRPTTFGRGLGLELLKEFVNLNGGLLEVYSQNGYARVGASSESFTTRSTFFQGTVVSISLNCDERQYVLSTETTGEPLF